MFKVENNIALEIMKELFVVKTSRYDLGNNNRSLKSVRIRSFSRPYFPAFGLNTKRYSISLLFSPNAGKYGTEKLRTRIFFTQ